MATLTVDSLGEPGALGAWWQAARPRTLLAGAAPVWVGTAVAIGEGGARLGPALAAFAGALLLQLASNLANDYQDFERGIDGSDRVGPARAAQQGWIGPGALRVAVACVLALAVMVGLYLVWLAGWPVAILGALSILGALTYAGGPWPFGHHGLGDLAVFLFFGVVAVTGTTYVQTLEWSGLALIASVPVGALATGILVINNLRDRDSDARAGKRTLAVRLGTRGTCVEFSGLLGIAYLCPFLLWLGGVGSAWLGLVLLTLPWAWSLQRTVWTSREGVRLNLALARCARLLLAFSVCFSIGWVL